MENDICKIYKSLYFKCLNNYITKNIQKNCNTYNIILKQNNCLLE